MATRIYTRSGDQGETGLFDGRRIAKSDPLIEAIGTLDELNCMIGVADAMLGATSPLPDDLLPRVQSRLFDAGAALAGSPDLAPGAAEVQWMENTIDEIEQGLPALKQFILPGGSPGGAALHAARGVCRRCERLLSAPEVDTAGSILPWINRLSDLLFVLARHVNRRAGIPETEWKSAQG